MTFVIDGVKVTGKLEDFTREEAAGYLEYCRERIAEPFALKEITVKLCDDGKVDVEYEAGGVKFERIRRITGYLVGTTDRWNDSKKAEERDRVKHGVGGYAD